jgi:ubiquinone/menaquinone biosynthesis C-methylase UbiE
MQSMYEYAVWRDSQDEVMRPGGLDLTRELLDVCEPKENAHVLDIGCGCGASLRLAQQRYGCYIFGLDISRQLLLRAKNRPSVYSLIQGDVNTLPLAENKFDLILLECVATIFGEETIFSTCRRLLKPGGKLLVTDLYARKGDGLPEIRKLRKGTCIQGIELKETTLRNLEACRLKLFHWADYSAVLKNFPMKTLSASLQIGMFEMVMAANSVNLGYYGMIAEK